MNVTADADDQIVNKIDALSLTETFSVLARNTGAASKAVARAHQLASLNAFISLTESASADRMSVAAVGKPLAGLPFAVKDNIDVKGLACTGGTPALRDWRPPSDAAVVKRLTAAGAVVIGKANLHELAAGITSDNLAYGKVANPYDAKRISGGSSGGSAVAVASGIVPVALGTDTAGSCRIPAALSGCVGFRSTVGRYSTDGLIPLSLTRDAIGIFARDVAHVALLDFVLANDNSTGTASVAGRRLGIPRPYFYDNLDKDVRAITEAALMKLADASAVLVETEVIGVERLCGAISLPIMMYEGPRDLAQYLFRHQSAITVANIVEQIAGPVEKGLMQTALWNNPIHHHDYVAMLTSGRTALIQAYRDCFARDGLDALVLPTTPLPARIVGEDSTVTFNGQQVPALQAYIRNTDPTSVAGMPSISIPSGMTPSGLPVGLLLDGLPGSDAFLLELAQSIEALLPPIPRPKNSF